MKTKSLQIMMLLAVSMSVAAFAGTSVLNISTNGNAFFNVSMDNYNYPSTNFFRTEGVEAGNHFVRVFNPGNYNNITKQNVSRVLYEGWITVNPFEEFSAMIVPNGNLFIQRTVIPQFFQPAPWCYKPQQNNNCNNYSYNNYNNYNVVYGMSADNFYAAKQSILDRWFDSSKLETAKMVLNSNNITSTQLYELMTLLDFESSKLELAKYGYSSVLDKQNIFKIYHAFDFDSSIKSFNDFIR